jgi:23S rRNA pseudouridine2605 synthase
MTKAPAKAPPRPRLAPGARKAAAPAAKATPGERIAKVLARAGVASRREAEALIAAGDVMVNGKRIDSPALNVTPKDKITLRGKPLAEPEPSRLWLYHKPPGLVTTTRDEQGRPTVFDNLPEGLPRVMSIGRLDLNSEGLLLLTNDGDLKRRLELPSTGWLRKYRVRINGRPEDSAFDPLRTGITVEGENFQPMTVTLDRQQGANAWLTIAIREGKNREIRRAMEAVGFTVNRLIRVSYGPFKLDDVAPGAVSEIRPRVLRDQLGLDVPSETPAGAGPSRPATRPAAKANDNPASRRTGAKPADATAPRRVGAKPADTTAPRRASAKPADTAAPRRTGGPTSPDARPSRVAKPATGSKPGTTARPARSAVKATDAPTQRRVGPAAKGASGLRASADRFIDSLDPTKRERPTRPRGPAKPGPKPPGKPRRG